MKKTHKKSYKNDFHQKLKVNVINSSRNILSSNCDNIEIPNCFSERLNLLLRGLCGKSSYNRLILITIILNKRKDNIKKLYKSEIVRIVSCRQRKCET